ncbi:MAG: D-alanyl-D-alanine carboxypeptidase [Bacteroidales bacterium]|nr:D-alanyl-D-alanine carboxypeptidase [Bacteroidales bacterium]
MRRFLCIFTVLLAGFSTLGSDAFAAVPDNAVQRRLEALDAAEPLRSSVWGVLAVNFKGDTLACVHARRRMIPASNMKLITTGAALLQLGPSSRFSTQVGIRGAVKDSTLLGDVCLVGGGDPTIGTLFSYLPAPQTHFEKWAEALRGAGIRRVEGRIVGDGSWLANEGRHTDWSSEDERTRDGVVPGGLTFRGAMGDSLPDGALSCAIHFRRYLEENGIAVSGPCAEEKTDSVQVLASFPSPQLRSLVRTANFESDNFIAETLLLALGRKLRGATDYDGATLALQDALAPLGLKACSRSMRFADGSGLSRKNYLSPEFTVRFLTAMSRTGVYKDYLASLPAPGKGTLKTRLKALPAEQKARIRMKSGSMNGVRCFSGYILPADGNPAHTIAFSVFTNNVVAPGAAHAALVDGIIEELLSL